MRLYFDLTKNIQPVSFSYQHYLIGRFHKWLGSNSMHNGMSLYSLGWLKGGKFDGKFLQFENGAQWMISAFDEEVLRKIADKALSDPEVFAGMKVKKIVFQQTPEFGSKYVFRVGSPVLIKDKLDNGRTGFITFLDADKANDLMTKTLMHKLDRAGLSDYKSNLKVYFDKSYKRPKTKLVEIKSIKNKGSLCPVIVEGHSEAVEFAWNVGIGNCTGSGFGSLL